MSSSVWDDDGSDAIAVVTPGPGITSLTSVGDGAEVLAGVSELTGAATLKTLVAGNLIEIVESPTQLEFNFTGTPTYNVDNASTSFLFIAEVDQTAFEVTEDVTIETVHVWINGLKLIRTIDFTVTPITKTITLTVPCSGSERVEIIVTGAFAVEYDLSPFGSLTVEATTLATGEDATAAFNAELNLLSLGLPRGPQGIGFVWRGDWSGLSDYAVNDVVAEAGRLWLAHAPSTNKEPATEPAYWHLYIRTPFFRGAWDNVTQYYVNDIVYHNGICAVAKFDNIDSEPVNADWLIVAVSGADGDTGATGATGNGIASIVRTSGTGAAGTTDTYTITYTDATTTTFTVYNGANGAGDVVGPAAATDGNIVLFDGATGKLVKNSAYSPASFATSGHNHDATYAPVAKGVTNGDSHDHSGGDGAQIAYSSLSGLPSVREVLTAARSYYVRSDGSDSNTGLGNTSGTAFLTIQKAIDTVAALDLGVYDVTIYIGTGTWTSSILLKSLVGSGTVTIRGINADLTSTVISTTSASAITTTNGAGFSGKYNLQYMKLQTTTSGSCINPGQGGGGIVLFGNVSFGACAENHIVTGATILIQANANYTISGSAASHISSYDGGHVRVQSVTVTISGTPAFSSAYAVIGRAGTALLNGCTFSGSATGKRYDVTLNGILLTAGGATYLPGNVSGTTATGGQYA